MSVTARLAVIREYRLIWGSGISLNMSLLLLWDERDFVAGFANVTAWQNRRAPVCGLLL
jgi:hypothetical protein